MIILYFSFDLKKWRLSNGFSDELSNEKWNILDKVKHEGKVETAALILNALADDHNYDYTIEELAERFGFDVEEIVNRKSE